MASKKISQLPAASIVTNTSLLAVVNTSSGITEKATVSQLPLGINNVNNLGSGTALGAISGNDLQLKTLIPGTAITFTTNSNTVTIASNLSINSVGSGTSIINSFANPNLSLKSLVAGAGITITDNTTNITIASSINASLDSIIGSLEVPTIKTYILENYINKAYTVNKIYLSNSSGTATVRIRRLDSAGADLTVSNTFNVSTTVSENIITSMTTAVGNQLVLEVLTSNSALNLSFTIEINYI